ncbi:Glyoxalase/Bleomycin resistance protein/Dioxygenase superfamily protein [Collimonas sp. OK607]|uniref:VOC family protein n=1 Tax=Collimonas sp. OK607 TaxID=1798194 RepID=UPI0008E3041B|nr:VOC family protein [Collimonas sp. OK607]SFB01216.1 Glyoxalase/Bleomycin resistance protein/Dioxygenase superfamily protein [Collimonas sp. OK607]
MNSRAGTKSIVDVQVTSETTLSNSFMGEAMQICVVTRDLHRTMQQFVRLGVGPWRVYTFDETTVKDLTYRGEKRPYSMRLALAWSGSTFWEIIQPLDGESIYTEWLAKHGEGIQHVALTCNGISFEDRIAEFERRGHKLTQSGSYLGAVRYAYLDTEESTGFAVELLDFPEGFEMPEPEEWYPAAPAVKP